MIIAPKDNQHYSCYAIHHPQPNSIFHFLLMIINFPIIHNKIVLVLGSPSQVRGFLTVPLRVNLIQ